MNRASLDFPMAKRHHADVVLKAIAAEAINVLFEHADTNRIWSILLTGSVANGEGTVIKYDSSVMTSDFDFEVYMGSLYFLRKRAYILNLSQQISRRLEKKGFNTHIGFLPSTNLFRTGMGLASSDIYEYEFANASKLVFGRMPSFNKIIRPSRGDALELVFTVVSELVFSRLKRASKIVESYNFTKRALTLLNSILIFHGIFAATYEKRLELAKEYASKGVIPLSEEEIKTLEVFTEYKLSGSPEQIMDSLGCKDIDDLIQFQENFLKKLTTKILYNELAVFTGKFKAANFKCNGSIDGAEEDDFYQLLEDYFQGSKVHLLSRIAGIGMHALGLFARNAERKELFATFIFYKQSPKVVLNFLITLLFLHERTDLAAKILGSAFPWMKLDPASAFRRLFSLWQFAEQSIKLN